MIRDGTQAIATVGPIGSGKDTAIEYISKRYKIPMISMGRIAVDIAQSMNIKPTRENLHLITERCLRSHGPTFFSEETIRRVVKQGWRSVAIAGLRYPTDVAMLRRCFRLMVIYIRTSSPETRFERLKRRREPRDPRTFEEFIAQDESENRMFSLKETFAASDVEVENNGSMKELYQKLDSHVHRFLERMDETDPT